MKVDLRKRAIDTNDFGGVRELMSSDPGLHAAPLGYNKNGPLTWVAECRVPWGPPSVERLTMAAWMLENGSDVHQGGDGPLIRTALNRMRSLQAVTDTAVVTKLVKCEAGANTMDSSACGRPLKSAAVFRFKDPDGNTLSISEHPEYPSSCQPVAEVAVSGVASTIGGECEACAAHWSGCLSATGTQVASLDASLAPQPGRR